MTEEKVFQLRLDIREEDDRTEASASLELNEVSLVGQGQARRNPTDPSVPQIGEEIAAARALSDLAHRLLDTAARSIEQAEGHRVELRD